MRSRWSTHDATESNLPDTDCDAEEKAITYNLETVRPEVFSAVLSQANRGRLCDGYHLDVFAAADFGGDGQCK
jgi:hypothetical protein